MSPAKLPGTVFVLTLVLAPAGLVPACRASLPPGAEEVLVLDVAPQTVQCVGAAAQRCLLVRAPDETEWRNFYGVIGGFNHEEGYRYRIRVSRRRVPDPPADGPAFEYRLLEILAVGPGMSEPSPTPFPGPRREAPGTRTMPGTCSRANDRAKLVVMIGVVGANEILRRQPIRRAAGP